MKAVALGAGGGTPGRIGPNAILQCMVQLDAACGAAAGADLMRRAGLGAYVERPPQQMVDEREVRALHETLRAVLGIGPARALGRAAGLATGDYLLKHRIPAVARVLLPRLPAGLAARLLLAAVSRHAWTFCGSGRFDVRPADGGRPLRVSLCGSATSVGAQSAEPLCDYFAATFERLFQSLVHPRTRVVETACMAMGAPSCEFEIRWS